MQNNQIISKLLSIMDRDELIRRNSITIENEIAWFSRVLSLRMQHYFSDKQSADFLLPDPPDLAENQSLYGELIRHFGMSSYERLVLIISLLPHLRPGALDLFFTRNNNFNRGFAEFGGITGLAHSGFLPTGETAMFLITGDNLEKRFKFSKIFSRGHFFYKANILKLAGNKPDEPQLSGMIKISEEWLEMLITGNDYDPPYTSCFPARRITTTYRWEELVLEETTLDQVLEIITWIKHGPFLMQEWQLNQRLSPGYKALFFGPPGTGKTLTASLIGKFTGMDVYRIDLSMVISKYIGETEKNLAALFDQAENKNWILFFDEADALFGERTEVKTSNDRSANQEIAYLLQRVETFPGIVILATNMSSNIDQAFLRRFQTVIPFPVPDQNNRLRLWEICFKDKPFPLDPGIQLADLAKNYELTGGNIVNVLRHACLLAINREQKVILKEDIIRGIQREFMKIGRLFRE